MPRFLLPLLSLLWMALAQPALAQTPAAPSPALTPEQARSALDMLQNDAKRAQMIDTLRALAATAPANPAAPASAPSAPPPSAPQTSTTPSSTPPSSATPAPAAPSATGAPAAPATAEQAASDAPLAADSLGAQLLLTVSEQVSDFSRSFVDATRTVTHFPLLWYWLTRTAADPAAYQTLLDIAWKLALVLGCALAAEWLLRRLLRRPLAMLETRAKPLARDPARDLSSADVTPLPGDRATEPELRRRRLDMARLWQSLVRVPLVLARLVIDLLPVFAFAAVGNILLGAQLSDVVVSRLVILAIVNAYVLCQSLIYISRAIVSAGPLSFWTVSGETAAYIEIWTRRIAIVGVSGIALANVALLLGLYRPGYLALVRLVMLVVHLLVVVIILQIRAPVARLLRGPENSTSVLTRARNHAARLWHYVAIVVVMALWAVWALNIRNGYSLLAQYLVGTLAVVVLARVLTIALVALADRLFRINPEFVHRFPGLEARANRYLPALRRTLAVIVTFVAFVALLEVWGVDAIVWFYSGQIGSRLVAAAFTVGIAVVAAVGVWEVCNALMERQITRLGREGHVVRAARLRTFQPMARTALLCIIIAVVALTALSEIGVNVAPLLAGAGIIGIAIGFGSQKLVQDLITGLFLLLENAVQVGDTVTVSGLTGKVENLSIRTIRLRAGDGAVHIIPFSAVTSVTNTSRGSGNAAISVNVAYHEDTDRVSKVLAEIAGEMRQDPDFQHLIRSDMELWGVDKVDGSMATIVGQIPCTDSGRWKVQREFNRRMKRRFQETGIEIAGSTPPTILLAAPPADTEAPPARKRVAG